LTPVIPSPNRGPRGEYYGNSGKAYTKYSLNRVLREIRKRRDEGKGFGDAVTGALEEISKDVSDKIQDKGPFEINKFCELLDCSNKKDGCTGSNMKRPNDFTPRPPKYGEIPSGCVCRYWRYF
jgi:hypothetical protein